MLKFNNNGITCIFLNLINLLFKIFTGSDFLSKWLTNEESIYYFISLRLFWSKKIWFIIKFVCHIYKCYEPYLLQLPILDFSMRHFEILLNVKCCTWYYRKCQKKNCLVVIQIHLLQIMNQNAKISLVIHHTIIWYHI